MVSWDAPFVRPKLKLHRLKLDGIWDTHFLLITWPDGEEFFDNLLKRDREHVRAHILRRNDLQRIGAGSQAELFDLSSQEQRGIRPIRDSRGSIFSVYEHQRRITEAYAVDIQSFLAVESRCGNRRPRIRTQPELECA